MREVSDDVDVEFNQEVADDVEHDAPADGDEGDVEEVFEELFQMDDSFLMQCASRFDGGRRDKRVMN